ncbi:MAG: hypothetical protein KatS3mg050_0224 [Litorilinea sp.]|nr:MAG: hypothetical protein KatS3mg050_0224 [Litorilinea sp.]
MDWVVDTNVLVVANDRNASQASPKCIMASVRKFVAVALVHGGNPPILNAVDSDWWDYREPLTAAGVRIEFLCPEQFSEDVSDS